LLSFSVGWHFKVRWHQGHMAYVNWLHKSQSFTSERTGLTGDNHRRLELTLQKLNSISRMACLLLSAPANDVINTVKCPGCDKQDVGRVDRDSVAASTACAAIWNVNYSAFQQFQHALSHSTQPTDAVCIGYSLIHTLTCMCCGNRDLSRKRLASRWLRSATSTDYHIPCTRTKLGDRAFSIAGPKTWNNLPQSVRSADCLDSFKRKLNFYFINSF